MAASADRTGPTTNWPTARRTTRRRPGRRGRAGTGGGRSRDGASTPRRRPRARPRAGDAPGGPITAHHRPPGAGGPPAREPAVSRSRDSRRVAHDAERRPAAGHSDPDDEGRRQPGGAVVASETARIRRGSRPSAIERRAFSGTSAPCVTPLAEAPLTQLAPDRANEDAGVTAVALDEVAGGASARGRPWSIFATRSRTEEGPSLVWAESGPLAPLRADPVDASPRVAPGPGPAHQQGRGPVHRGHRRRGGRPAPAGRLVESPRGRSIAASASRRAP